jgi:RNase P protein component
MNEIAPGYDIVFIARFPIRDADFREIDAACARLLRRASLLIEEDASVQAQPVAQAVVDHTEAANPPQGDESD